MRQLLLSTAALILLAMPALAQPHGDEGHSNRVGKASVAPEVQDRAQAQLRGQTPLQDRGRGEERRGGDERIRANPAPAPLANREERDRGERGQDRGSRDRNRDGLSAAQSQPTIYNRGDRRDDANRQGRGDQDRGRDRRFQESRPDFNRDLNRDLNRDGRTDYRQPNFGGPRHDFSGFRDYHRNFHASRRFRTDFYRRPAGWYEHRWVYGEFLPAAFWARDYWLVDYQDYDLPLPPYGAIWVRVGSDALMIDEDSGEIITVAYDVFY